MDGYEVNKRKHYQAHNHLVTEWNPDWVPPNSLPTGIKYMGGQLEIAPNPAPGRNPLHWQIFVRTIEKTSSSTVIKNCKFTASDLREISGEDALRTKRYCVKTRTRESDDSLFELGVFNEPGQGAHEKHGRIKSRTNDMMEFFYNYNILTSEREFFDNIVCDLFRPKCLITRKPYVEPWICKECLMELIEHYESKLCKECYEEDDRKFREIYM